MSNDDKTRLLADFKPSDAGGGGNDVESFYSATEVSSAPQQQQASSSSEPAWARGEVQADVLQAKEQKLREMEERLKWRAHELDMREAAGGGGEASKNFPPCLPVRFRFLHVTPADSIHPSNRRVYRLGVLTWMVTEVGYVTNFVAVLSMVVAMAASFSSLLMAVLASTVGIYASYAFFLSSLADTLKAAEFNTCSALWHFFNAAFHVGFAAIACLSPPLLGGWNAGLFNAIAQFEGGRKVLGAMCLINSCIWGFIGLASLYIESVVLAKFRGGGGVQKAKDAGAAAIVAARSSLAATR